MDTQTRHALKNDRLTQTTRESVSWISEHRSTVVRWVIVGVIVLAAAIGAAAFWSAREAAADSALGAALDTYDAALATPGAPAQSGTYSTAADRSRAANKMFADVAAKFGWLPEGAKAHYFAGITYEDLGQTASAETELKTASGSFDHNLANLAKLALAGLYHQTARDGQAIDLYNELIAKPSETVTASGAQLDLADLYAASGKQDQARALWAKIKDADKDGAAGSIASQKLTPKQ